MNKSQSWLKLGFDRLLSKNLGIQFLVLGGIVIFFLMLSYMILPIWGEGWQEVCREHGISEWLLPIYLLIDSNALNNLYIVTDEVQCMHDVHVWQLVVSTIIFLFGAFVFNGIIIGIITNSIERRVTNHKKGRIHYLKSGHYVIMGYDDMVPSIILHIFERTPDAFVLLMSALDSEVIREKLRKVFDKKRQEHIIINYGHRTSMDYYKDIHLESAECVFIVGARNILSHDAINVECVDSICSYLEQSEVSERPKRITCVFEDLDTYAAFKTSEIFGRVGKLGIEFVPYNFYAGWAKQVFVKQFHTDKDRLGEKIQYPAVYGKGYTSENKNALTTKDTKRVHLVFVGTTNFAVSFAMEAAQVLHFPNGEKVKTLITFIDKNADTEKNEFVIRNRRFFEVQSYSYRDLSKDGSNKSKENSKVYFSKENGYTDKDANFLDVEFEFIKGDVFSQEIQEVIREWAGKHNKTQYLSMFLAMNEQHQNFVMAMNMPNEVYYNEVPVFIRQDRSDNFVSDLRAADEEIRTIAKKNTYYYRENSELKSKTQGGRYANIYPFGMNETGYSADENSLKRAKLINYLYSTMPNGDSFQSKLVLSAMSDEEIWKEADSHWRGLSVSLKWSNLYNAYSIPIKLASLRSMRGLALDDCSQDTWELSDDEVEVLARVEHNRWNVEKLLMGYRKAHKEEDKYAPENKAYKDKLKLNKNRFIHHDIRLFDDLDDVKNLDREFSRYIPWIIRMTDV